MCSLFAEYLYFTAISFTKTFRLASSSPCNIDKHSVCDRLMVNPVLVNILLTQNLIGMLL